MENLLIKNELLSLCARILVSIATIVVNLDTISWINHLGFGMLLKSICIVIIVLAMIFLFSYLPQVFYIVKLKMLSNKFDNSKNVYDALAKLRDIEDMLIRKEDWWEAHKTNELAKDSIVKSELIDICATLAIGFYILS